MPRIARVVVPDIPHHVTQRGNRNQKVFFCDKDRQRYLEMLRVQSRLHGVKIWAYCLMDNHVHLVVVPSSADSLRLCFQEVHRAHAHRINMREGWRGCLWQGRFSSFPMDDAYVYNAVRYVECNPVKANMVLKAEDHPWSSASAHVAGLEDPILSPFFLAEDMRDWSAYLRRHEESSAKAIEHCIRTGRPWGPPEFIERMEAATHRQLQKARPGPKPKGSRPPAKPVREHDQPVLFPAIR